MGPHNFTGASQISIAGLLATAIHQHKLGLTFHQAGEGIVGHGILIGTCPIARSQVIGSQVQGNRPN